ncbi:MAG: hypothetical protein IJF09_09315 [Ruminiclostridium sp.]|nr:hypothetical protein [Ruminiclostridium sp.]
MAFQMEYLTDEDIQFLNSFNIYNRKRCCINKSWYHNSKLLADTEREIYFIYIDGSGNIEQCPHHYALIWKGTVFILYRNSYNFDDWYVDAPYKFKFCKEELIELVNEVLAEYYDRVYTDRQQDEKRSANIVEIDFMLNHNMFLFLLNTKLLHRTFGITPLLYGSLGLEYLTGEDLNADDIDILIPQVYIKEKWSEFKETLQKNGYILTDEHEHTFCEDGVCYSYASIEELETFAGISVSQIEVKKERNASFRILSLEQYLTVYEKSSKDGYRVDVRNKKDEEKIKFIKEKLKGKNE